MDNDFVGMMDRVRDLVPAQGIGCFVPGKDVVSDLDQADWGIPILGRDNCVRTETVEGWARG